jgi:hypothetical protein
MRREPAYVSRKTAKGRVYYYFCPPNRSASGRPIYIPLPDIDSPEFSPELARLNALHPRVRKTPEWSVGASMIYFIGSDIGAIKIGRAIRPKVRLRQLQSGSPIPLMILATTPGGVDEEKAYHDRFRKQRIRGEWFERSAELLAEIRRLNET